MKIYLFFIILIIIFILFLILNLIYIEQFRGGGGYGTRPRYLGRRGYYSGNQNIYSNWYNPWYYSWYNPFYNYSY